MKENKFFNILLSTFILLAISHPSLAFQSQDLRMKISIFQVPPYQSIVKSEPAPPAEEGIAGGVKGTMTGGYITARFPNGIVLFETDLSQTNEDLIGFIKGHSRFAFPDFAEILPVADVYIRVDTENLETSMIDERMYLPRNSHLVMDYLLQILPLSIQNEEAVFKFRFSAKYKEAEGNKKKLLDQTLGISYSRTLIVGFPTNDDSGRGAVFWLAISSVPSITTSEKKTADTRNWWFIR